MNKIEDCKEQVPDMVYKDLIEAFAKARLGKTPDGYHVKVKYLETKVFTHPLEISECNCTKCTCTEEDEDDECQRCYGEEENCENCEVASLVTFPRESIIYFEGKDWFGNRKEGDWSAKVKEFFENGCIKNAPIELDGTKIKFNAYGGHGHVNENVKVKKEGAYVWQKIRYNKLILLGIGEMSPVYE